MLTNTSPVAKTPKTEATIWSLWLAAMGNCWKGYQRSNCKCFSKPLYQHHTNSAEVPVHEWITSNRASYSGHEYTISRMPPLLLGFMFSARTRSWMDLHGLLDNEAILHQLSYVLPCNSNKTDIYQISNFKYSLRGSVRRYITSLGKH